MTKDEKEKWLTERGWSTWHHQNYWVHPDSVEDKKSQDYTNYGMNLDDAVAYENLGKPKHRAGMGCHEMSRLSLAIETEGLTKIPNT